MATVKILQCSGCGANLSPQNNKCAYCGSINVIQAEVNPFTLDPALKSQYTQYFRDKAAANPKDVPALYSVGLFYLELKNYDLALKNFSEAISQSPDNPDVYYYYVLAMTGGKKPRKLMLKDMKIAEEYLNTAIRLARQSKFLILLAAMKDDFYSFNGLSMPGQATGELLAEARSLPVSQEDVEFLFQHVVIKDDNLVSQIRSN